MSDSKQPTERRVGERRKRQNIRDWSCACARGKSAAWWCSHNKQMDERRPKYDRRAALSLTNDCLNAAAKAGLKLVKQPLAEFADIPLGESFEFENVKAAELERRLAAAAALAEQKDRLLEERIREIGELTETAEQLGRQWTNAWGRVGELERALGEGMDLLDSLRGLLVAAQEDRVDVWAKRAAALLGTEGGDGSRQE